MLVEVEVSGAGRLILPWISRIARPEGVCRRLGSGFKVVSLVLSLGPSAEGRCSGMDGIWDRALVVLVINLEQKLCKQHKSLEVEQTTVLV